MNLKPAMAQSSLIFLLHQGLLHCLVSGHAHIPQASNINTPDAFSLQHPNQHILSCACQFLTFFNPATNSIIHVFLPSRLDLCRTLAYRSSSSCSHLEYNPYCLSLTASMAHSPRFNRCHPCLSRVPPIVSSFPLDTKQH